MGYAVAKPSVAVSISLLYLVPPIAVHIAWLWLGELPLPIELLGGMVVICGVIVISQGGRILARLHRRRATGQRLRTEAPRV